LDETELSQLVNKITITEKKMQEAAKVANTVCKAIDIAE
jgi:capsular polysaccharide biosynthesis protein